MVAVGQIVGWSDIQHFSPLPGGSTMVIQHMGTVASWDWVNRTVAVYDHITGQMSILKDGTYYLLGTGGMYSYLPRLKFFERRLEV